jgi:hypothetical protein
LKVDDGQGDFILEDSVYIPDVRGDYIKLDEILSEQTKIQNNERSFNFDKRWDKVLFKANSYFAEELPADDKQNGLWLIPFYYDNSKKYIFYNRRYNFDIRMFPSNNFHLINIKFNFHQELRTIGSSTPKTDESNLKVNFKQSSGESFFEQEIQFFEKVRDSYFNGSSGDISGYDAGVSYLRQIDKSEIKVSTSYRSAKSSNDDKSKTISFELKTRSNVFNRGELRTKIELYSQELNLINNNVLYLLTENHPGFKGGDWSVLLNYGLKEKMRINLSISGRHSDNRRARITGRMELVAGF